MKACARAVFKGTVGVFRPGGVNGEVEVEVEVDSGGGDTLVAVITRESARELGIAPGKAAAALIKADQVVRGWRLRLDPGPAKGRKPRFPFPPAGSAGLR